MISQRQCFLIVCLFTILTKATIDPDGVKCGNKRCAVAEYCSPYDTQCRSCSTICDPDDHNNHPELCIKDCQEYLHDQKYVSREEYMYELGKLKTTVTTLLSVVCLLIIGFTVLFCGYYIKLEKAKNIISKTWKRRKFFKKQQNSNKIQADVESGTTKQSNGLRVIMPTISGMVAVQNSNKSCKDDSCNGDATPSTSSTMLSRKVPSEDSTAEYAYDNPAMTPSPEVMQQRLKRESSF